MALSSRNGNGVDLAALAVLDLTGAGIVGSVRTAALPAAVEGTTRMSMGHLARGVSRQFRNEGRLAPPEDMAALAGRDGQPAAGGAVTTWRR
jgi:hypothetical protein